MALGRRRTSLHLELVESWNTLSEQEHGSGIGAWTSPGRMPEPNTNRAVRHVSRLIVVIVAVLVAAFVAALFPRTDQGGAPPRVADYR